MTKDDDDTMCYRSELEAAVKAAVAVERNKLAQWMIDRSYATGHGDTTEDLLKELEWQVREACAKVCEEVGNRDRDSHAWDAAVAIRARGQA